MDDITKLNPPATIAAIERATAELGFCMPSAQPTGSLIRTLAASKPGGQLLELGTGTGLATAWILDGLDATGKLDSMDNDGEVQAVAQKFLGDDPRLTLHVTDGDEFIHSLAAAGRQFDLIFADTWPGKLRLLDEALSLLNRGGFYVIDDMLPQPNWPDLDVDYDHPAAIRELIAALETRADLHVTKLAWDTGIIVGVKK